MSKNTQVSTHNTLINRFNRMDFENMPVNLFLCPIEKKVSDLYSEVLDIKVLLQIEPPFGMTSDQLLRYAIAIYDPNSPYNRISNIVERRYEAIKDSGIEINKSKFPEGIKNVLMGKDKIVILVAFHYLVRFYRPDVLTLAILVDQHEKFVSDVLDKDKMFGSNELSTFTSIQDAISNQEKKVFTGAKGLEIDDFYRFLRSESILLRPEDIASKIESGDIIRLENNFGKRLEEIPIFGFNENNDDPVVL